ncbi:unnamed protein product [Agarophyton chilense]
MLRFESLRAAVANTVAVHTAIVAAAERDETLLTAAQRAALIEQKRCLVEEVRVKNDKIKLLIDQLRHLHRDITVLVSTYYNAAPPSRHNK